MDIASYHVHDFSQLTSPVVKYSTIERADTNVKSTRSEQQLFTKINSSVMTSTVNSIKKSYFESLQGKRKADLFLHT